MIYGSICSGIEAATVAWHPLGWQAAWYSEIDPFCRVLLKHHYPEVRNFGDFTSIRGGGLRRLGVTSIDLLCGVRWIGRRMEAVDELLKGEAVRVNAKR